MSTDETFLQRVDAEIVDAVRVKPPVDLSDLAAARAGYRERMAALNDAAPEVAGVVTVEKVVPGVGDQPDVVVRVHRRRDGAAGVPAVLWVHGGGHVIGSAAQDDVVLRALVGRHDCVAVAVEWRHAPEDPYPASIDDCWTTLQWMADASQDHGIDPGHLVVAGASSGGGVAAGLVLLNRDRGGPPIAGQLLVYPMLDDRGLTRSARAVTDERVWNSATTVQGWDAYLGDLDRSDVPVYAAPGRATDLTGLPPTWIGAVELDPLVDEAIDYAKALLAAGVATELHLYPGAIHAVESTFPESAIARRFAAERDAALDRFLSR